MRRNWGRVLSRGLDVALFAFTTWWWVMCFRKLAAEGLTLEWIAAAWVGLVEVYVAIRRALR